jgi:hypothetical protein
MNANKKVSGNIITLGYQCKSFAMSIKNENGVHDHTRNGEHFRGKQKDCPLCKNGSAIEKSIGGIGL